MEYTGSSKGSTGGKQVQVHIVYRQCIANLRTVPIAGHHMRKPHKVEQPETRV